MPNKDITNSGLLNPNIQLGNIMLNNDDQKVILTKYKEMFGEPTKDPASVEKMNSVVKSYYDYKKKKLDNDADYYLSFGKTSNDIDPVQALKNVMHPAYQNAAQYKAGLPKSDLWADKPLEETTEEQIAQAQKKKTKAANHYPFSTDPVTAMVGLVSPKAKEGLNIVKGEYAEGMANFFADLFSGKIGNLLLPSGLSEIPKVAQRTREQEAMKKKGLNPATWQPTSKEYMDIEDESNIGKSYFSPFAFVTSKGKSWMSTPESRDRVYNAISSIGKDINTEIALTPEEAKKQGIGETTYKGLKMAGSLATFFTPVAGEEYIASKLAPLLKNANRIQRIGATGVSMLPGMIPKIHANSLARGEEMGLSGRELNEFANKNTLANAAIYALIPNVVAQRLSPAAAKSITKLITEPARQGAIPQVLGVLQRAGLSGVAGSAAAAAEMGISNTYLPEDKRVGILSKEGKENLTAAFFTNAIIHTFAENKTLLNSRKSGNRIYTDMVFDLAKDYDGSIKKLTEEYEKSNKTAKDKEKLNLAASVLTKIKPYVPATAGIPEGLQGLAAFEMAKIEDLVNKKNKVDPSNIQELAAIDAQIENSSKTIQQLVEGKYTRGKLMSPEEVIKMADQNTPGRLRPIQVMKMADHFGFKTETLDPQLFANDPGVIAYLNKLKNGEVAPQEDNNMPVVVGSDGKLIDGRKRVAKALFDIENGTYKAKDSQGNKMEVMVPLSDSEIANNIDDLSAFSGNKKTGYFLKNKRINLTEEMKKLFNIKGKDGQDTMTLAEAINEVYHNTKQRALDKALGDEKITVDDILSEALTGEIDGQKAEDKVRALLIETAHMNEVDKQAALQAFADRVNEQNTANINANIPAFVKTIDFLARAGVKTEAMGDAIADALGIAPEYVKGYMKKLAKDGKIREVKTEDLFENATTKGRKKEAAEAKKQATENKTKTTVVEPTVEEPNVEEEPEPLKVSDALDNIVEFGGKKGTLFVDEENNIIFNDGKVERVLGKTTDEAFVNSLLEDAGIKIIEPLVKGVTVEGENAVVDGQKQKIISINKNLEGDVVSYTYETADGKLRTSRNVEVAEEIHKQQLLQDIEAQELTPEQQAEASKIVSEEFSKEYGGEAERVIDEMPEEVADIFANMMQGFKKIDPQALQEMVIRASEWVDKAKQRVERSKAPEAEKKKVTRMLDLFDNDLTKYYEKLEKQRLSKTNAPTKAKAAKSAGQNKASTKGEPKPSTEPTRVEEKEPIKLEDTVGKIVTLADGRTGVVVEWAGGTGVSVRLPNGEGVKMFPGKDIVSVRELTPEEMGMYEAPNPEESDTVTEDTAFGSNDEDLFVPTQTTETVTEETAPLPEKEVKARYNEIIASGNQENLKSLFDELASLKDEDGLPLFERDPNNPKECP